MKSVISLAVALLITPSSTIQLKHKANFPAIPVDGNQVAALLIGGGEEVLRELGRELDSQNCESDWNENIVRGSPEDQCWERGLKRDIRRSQEDLAEGMQQLVGLDYSSNIYDAQFISDLIQAEAANLVSLDQTTAGAMINDTFDAATTTLTGLGLAQTMQDNTNCREQWWQIEDAERQACTQADYDTCPGVCCQDWQRNEGFWQTQRAREDEFRMTCMLEQSEQVATAAANLGTPEEFAANVRADVQAANDALTNDPQGSTSAIAQVITHVNSLLTSEATRVGVELPAGGLPDPQDTATKLVTLLQAGTGMVLGADAEEFNREAGRARMDTLQEVYQMDRVSQRDLDRAAEEATENGITVTSAQLRELNDGVLNAFQTVIANPEQVLQAAAAF